MTTLKPIQPPLELLATISSNEQFLTLTEAAIASSISIAIPPLITEKILEKLHCVMSIVEKTTASTLMRIPPVLELVVVDVKLEFVIDKFKSDHTECGDCCMYNGVVVDLENES